MRARAENVVPDPADGLHAWKNMGEPGQHPGNNEDDQINLLEALKYLIELRVFLAEKGQDHLTDQNAKSANIVS